MGLKNYDFAFVSNYCFPDVMYILVIITHAFSDIQVIYWARKKSFVETSDY